MSKVKSEEAGGGPVSYWESERIVAWSFNRLKAKLYNLVEGSVEKDKKDALKALVKGFANDEYKMCIREMRYWGRSAKILDEGSDSSLEIAEPLENKDGIFG